MLRTSFLRAAGVAIPMALGASLLVASPSWGAPAPMGDASSSLRIGGDHRSHDLSGKDHRGAVAHHANFEGAQMHHSKFHRAKLHNSSFAGAQMHRSVFRGAAMHRSDFSGASMHSGEFHRASMHRSNFRGADLNGSVFHKAELHHSDMRGVDLRGAKLTKTRMHDVDLRRAQVKDADFRGANLRGANLRNLNPERSTRCMTCSPDAGSSSFAGADLTGADLTNANLAGIDFTVADVTGANFSGANLSGANFTSADLSGADFSGADLSGANLSNATVGSADFTNADLSSATLSGTNLTSATLKGADLTGVTSVGTTYSKASICSLFAGSAVNLGGGTTASQITYNPFNKSRQVTMLMPSGLTLTGSVSCSSSGVATISVSGSAASFTSPVSGLTLQQSNISGTIVLNPYEDAPTWDVSVGATLTRNGITATGTLDITSSTTWEIDWSASTAASVTDTDGTYPIASVSGTLYYNNGVVSGGPTLTLNGTPGAASLASRLSGWTTKATLSIAVEGKLPSPTVSATMSLTAKAPSGGGNVSFTGDWTPGGYALTGSGKLGFASATSSGGHGSGPGPGHGGGGSGGIPTTSPAAALSGTYTSKGYQGAPAASWSLSTTVTNASIGKGAVITEGTLSASSSAPGFTGSLTVKPASNSSRGLSVTANVTDSKNWTMTVVPAQTSTSLTIPGLPGLSLDTSTTTGTITSTAGAVSWALSLGTVNWAVTNASPAISVNATLTASSSCPLSPSTLCGTQSGVFLGFTNGTVTRGGNAMTMQGAILADGSWMMMRGTSNADPGLSGPLGSLTISSPTVTIWKGDRPACAVSDIVMPDLGGRAASRGAASYGIEFAGSFTGSVPGYGSKSMSGCVDYGSSGLVVGMKGLGASLGSGSAGAVSVQSASLSGWGWTDIPSLPSGTTIGLSGSTVSLLAGVNSVAGSLTVPGTLATAAGLSTGQTSLPMSGTFSNVSSGITDASFNLKAVMSVGWTRGGVTLDDVAIAVSKSGNAYQFSLSADAHAKINGETINLTGIFSAGSGGTISLSLTATGSRTTTTDPVVNGTSVALPNPQTGYSYLSDTFMGIPGAHLWSITAQVGIAAGLPSVAFSSTVYYDPTKVPMMKGTTWLKGGMTAQISEDDPCLAFGFDGTGTGTALSIDSGLITVPQFTLSFSTLGCTVGAVTVPKGAAFNFTAGFGNQTTLSLALLLGTDANGNKVFSGSESVTNLTIGGMTFSGTLSMKVTSTSQETTLGAQFDVGYGSAKAKFDLENSSSDMTMSGSVSLVDWDFSTSSLKLTDDSGKDSSGGFDLKSLNYDMTMTVSKTSTSCTASSTDFKKNGFSTTTSGNMTLGNRSLSFSGNIAVSCGQIEVFNLSYDYIRGSFEQTVEIDYDSSTKTFSSDATFEFSKKTDYKGNYGRTIDIYLDLSLRIYGNDMSSSYMSFTGRFDGSKVSGSISATIGASKDDASASFSIKINDVISWSDSWSW